MLCRSDDSLTIKGHLQTREIAPSTTTRQKVHHLMANTSLNSPAGRDFKQVERQHSHDRYQRLIYSALASIAFLALLGSFSSFYFGYYVTGSVLLCMTGGISAFNQWLRKTIPEHKVNPEKCKQLSPQAPACLDPSPRAVVFHGVTYTALNHKRDVNALPTIIPPPIISHKPVTKKSQK